MTVDLVVRVRPALDEDDEDDEDDGGLGEIRGVRRRRRKGQRRRKQAADLDITGQKGRRNCSESKHSMEI